MDLGGRIGALANKCKKINEGDYIKDGLYYCGKCNTPKQTKVFMVGFGYEMMPFVPCKCENERIAKEKQERKQRELMDRISDLKKMGFPDRELSKCTFELDDRKNEKISNVMKNYADNFNSFRAKGKGLLLYGNVGAGKSFLSACVVNALIEKGIPCLMTNFARLTNIINGMFEGKQDYIDSLNDFDLLVIDDLGAERDTEFMNETVHNIIDSRSRAGKPLRVQSVPRSVRKELA